MPARGHVSPTNGRSAHQGWHNPFRYGVSIPYPVLRMYMISLRPCASISLTEAGNRSNYVLADGEENTIIACVGDRTRYSQICLSYSDIPR